MEYQPESIEYEKRLLVLMSQDDEGAFCELYAHYKNKLLYFTRRLIKSTEHAEDICQDIFALVWQNRKSIDIELSFSSYLFTIARNRVLNILRNINREQCLYDYIIAQTIDHSSNALNDVSVNELQEILKQAVSKLTARQKQVFAMSREQCLSHKEIADTLSISVYTVQEHLSLAIKSIHKHITKYYTLCGVVFLSLLSCVN